MQEDDCVFCNIAAGKTDTRLIRETGNIVAFYDIKPSAEVHILIAPKSHIETFTDIKGKDAELIVEMIEVAQDIIKEKKLMGGYKMIFNGGKYQIIPHLHWHLVAGKLEEAPV